MGRIRRTTLAIATTAALVLVLGAVARAHATLVSAEPPQNAVLATSPSRVRLVFDEELDPSLARVSLIAGNGRSSELRVSGDPRDVRAIIAPLASLAPGAYRVHWRVVSADGHPVDGSYVFTVGASRAAPPPLDSSSVQENATWGGPPIAGAPLIPALLRGLAVGTLMAMTGFLGFAVFPAADAEDDTKLARIARVSIGLSAAAFVLLLAYFAAWILNASPTHTFRGDATSALLRSGIARVEEWRLLLALLSVWATGLARRPALALTFGVVAVALSGGTGHSAAMDPVVATPARALHLLAAATWLGGLAWLLTLRGGSMLVFRAEAMRVSRIALWAVVLIALSGTVQAFVFLPSVGALFTSAYGVVTLAKVAGLCVLVGFGAYHRARSLPRITQPQSIGTFARVLRAEVAVMALVILLGGWLAYISPPHVATPATSAHS